MGAWRAAALAAEFGFSVAFSMLGGVYAGLYLDRQFHTAPVFFFVGLACGLASTIYLIYLIYRTQLQPSGRSADSAAPPETSTHRRAP